MHPGLVHVAAVERAEIVVGHLADEGCPPAERGDAGDRVPRRTTRALDRRRNRLVQRVGARRVDQMHRALGELLGDQKIVVDARHHVDDGVADAENVELGVGHGGFRGR
jgi:hypothetical protein